MPLPPFSFSGAHAVVTGAASGMGEQMAMQLAARGTSLVLIDRDAERLEAVALTIRARFRQITVNTEVADLADTPAIDALVDRVLAVSPQVDLLINNAGVALGGAFADLSAEEFDWVQAINFRAPVALVRGFLPALRASRNAHIVNLSSLFGLIGPPGQSAYSSSKYALRGFSDVIRHELEPEGIGVTTVHPGGIRTNIAKNARVASGVSEEDTARGQAGFAKLLTYPADKAAAEILAGVEKRKARVVITREAKGADVLVRLFPSRYFAIMAKLSPAATRNSSSGGVRSTPGAPVGR